MRVCNVGINNRFDCRKSAFMLGREKYYLMYFKSPVCFTSNGEKCNVSGKSVVISSGRLQFGVSEILLGGYVVFEPDLSDLEFINGLGIRMNKVIPVSDDYNIVEMLRCLSLEFKKKNKFKSEFSSQALKLIMIHIGNIVSSKNSENDKLKHYDFLSDIRDQIFSSPFEKIEINDICSELSIGRTYFHRIYSAYFGTTYVQDIINSKLEAAKRLLLESNDSISIIAEKCGYESDSYFMRQFKKHVGITPSVYRKKYSELL